MNFNKSEIETIQNAAKSIHDNEKFAVAILAVRANKAAEQNPYDVALTTASRVLTKMANDNKMFISRAELNSLYDKINSTNTILADIFAVELDRAPLKGPTLMQRSDETTLSDDYLKVADPLLSNALNAAFGDTKESKLYTIASATKAEKSCMFGLSKAGLTPKCVDVFAGKNDIIVCQATYETPKGPSYVLVPIEIDGDKALIPNLFLSQAGFIDLETENLKDHIRSTAGKSYKIDGEKLIDVLITAKNGAPETVGEVDLALIKLKAEQETPSNYTVNGILYQQLDNPVLDIKDPDVELSEEHKSFATRLASPKGIANYLYGNKTVDAGINMISRALIGFGFKYAQVSVSKAEEGEIIYAVAVDREAGFKIPVKVEGDKVMPPTVVFASGNVAEFSKDGLSKLMQTSQVDNRAMAQASAMYDLKPSELMAQVRDGILNGNLLKVEDAITALGEIDSAAQKMAINLMMDSFNPSSLKKVASEQSGCKMITKTSSSKHLICGHLNIPTHKVYQDKNGDCQPLYRKGMEETSEGGTFLAYKIFQ